MKKYNVLLLSAGRRVELVDCFHRAARRLGVESRIIAADLTNLAPALYEADAHYLIPKIGAKDYIQTIIKICNDEEVSLVVPTIDSELLILAENKQQIEANTAAKVLISDLEIIRCCRDKALTQKFFEENGFCAPQILGQEELEAGNYELPLFIKPVDGSSSKNAYKINSKEELVFLKEYIQNPIVQAFAEGTEFSIDCFLDFSSNVISVVPRQRLATRAGEIMKGRIDKDHEVINDVTRLLNTLKPIGHITVQCIKTKHEIVYIEINPRFGGGAPMSIRAGADSCEYLYRLLIGEELEYNEDYTDHLTFLRFDSSIVLDAELTPIKNKDFEKNALAEAATDTCRNTIDNEKGS